MCMLHVYIASREKRRAATHPRDHRIGRNIAVVIGGAFVVVNRSTEVTGSAIRFVIIINVSNLSNPQTRTCMQLAITFSFWPAFRREPR